MSSHDYLTILQLIGDKTPEGLKLLYERYGKPFYSYALKRWELTEDDALDVVYKTLETLVLKLANYEFRTQAMFDGFLFKVFINFLRQKHREIRTKQLPQLEFFDLEQEFKLPIDVHQKLTKQAFSDFYSSEMLESPNMKLLKESLELLEETERDILLLLVQNYSYDEIARMLVIHNNQLKVKHHRARQKLMNLISKMTLI